MRRLRRGLICVLIGCGFCAFGAILFARASGLAAAFLGVGLGLLGLIVILVGLALRGIDRLADTSREDGDEETEPA